MENPGEANEEQDLPHSSTMIKNTNLEVTKEHSFGEKTQGLNCSASEDIRAKYKVSVVLVYCTFIHSRKHTKS